MEKISVPLPLAIKKALQSAFASYQYAVKLIIIRSLTHHCTIFIFEK
jgi:hypothetical protein